MLNLYNRNGLLFWSEEEIEAREMLVGHFYRQLKLHLETENSAFRFFRCEAPLLTPASLLNPEYLTKDEAGGQKVFSLAEDLALRPETTMRSYAYAEMLLNPHNYRKVRPPLVVWQYGKSFRQEQDQPLKHMKLKEFYQLEFQIIFSPLTANDYYPGIVNAMHKTAGWLFKTDVAGSDRVPAYAEETMDLVSAAGLEIASISRRTDFVGAKVIEVALGMDRIVSCFLEQ